MFLHNPIVAYPIFSTLFHIKYIYSKQDNKLTEIHLFQSIWAMKIWSAILCVCYVIGTKWNYLDNEIVEQTSLGWL